MPWHCNLILMYYDIIQVESVDENGNTIVTLEPQTVPPVYDDIKPEDMSLENQQKANLTLNKVRTKQPSQLSISDNVGSQIVQKGETLVLVDPVSDPVSDPASEPIPEPDPEPKK